jgi:molybdate transport system ATP-binding protein
MNTGIEVGFVKRFSGGAEIRVDATLVCEQATVTVLFGPSGAGKTTVLRCLAGLATPEEGSIRFRGETWSDTATRTFVPARKRNVGFVPQEFALFPHLSVEDNLGYAVTRWHSEERQCRVAELVQWLGLGGLERRLPQELSGGQQQRVALGRAVASRPALLLLDEPLAALDAPTRIRLRTELRRLLKSVNTPTVLVTHDRIDALALGDHLVVMDGGKMVQQGRPADVFNRPASLAVAGIVATETVQPGRVMQSGELVTVTVGDQTLTAACSDPPAEGQEVFVCIRAEDVILLKGSAPKSSARNTLRASVRELVAEGPMVRVELDCGFPLKAFLTKQAREELALRQGDEVLAMVKAPNVHLIPRSS